MDTVEIRIARALQNAAIVCPDRACGMHCHCTGYLPGEWALFECRACQTRYHVGLGPAPLLRAESIAPTEAVA